MAGAWYAVALVRQGAALAQVLASENLRRFTSGDDHAHCVGYLLPLTLVGLLPWTPLLPLAFAPLRRDVRSAPATLAAAWFAAGFAFFSLAAAKRSVYVLGLYPAVALPSAPASPKRRRTAASPAWRARAASSSPPAASSWPRSRP